MICFRPLSGNEFKNKFNIFYEKKDGKLGFRPLSGNEFKNVRTFTDGHGCAIEISFRPLSGNEFKNTDSYLTSNNLYMDKVFVPFRGMSLKTITINKEVHYMDMDSFRPLSGNEFKNNNSGAC